LASALSEFSSVDGKQLPGLALVSLRSSDERLSLSPWPAAGGGAGDRTLPYAEHLYLPRDDAISLSPRARPARQLSVKEKEEKGTIRCCLTKWWVGGSVVMDIFELF